MKELRTQERDLLKTESIAIPLRSLLPNIGHNKDMSSGKLRPFQRFSNLRYQTYKWSPSYWALKNKYNLLRSLNFGTEMERILKINEDQQKKLQENLKKMRVKDKAFAKKKMDQKKSNEKVKKLAAISQSFSLNDDYNYFDYFEYNSFPDYYELDKKFDYYYDTRSRIRNFFPSIRGDRNKTRL